MCETPGEAEGNRFPVRSRIHPSADVSPDAEIGVETYVWHHAHVREGAVIGSQCILGKGTYIDRGVEIGNRCKVQNEAQVFGPALIEDGVFIGPGALITNDRYPRAIGREGELKRIGDWTPSPVHIQFGASVGAGAIVVSGTRVGAWALVGAGAVVVDHVPPHGLVLGVPARLAGYACACGRPLEQRDSKRWVCPCCGREFRPELGNRGRTS